MKAFLKVLSYIGAALLGAAIAVILLTGEPENVSKLDQLEDYIDTFFIEDVDRTALEDAAAAAMIDATGDRWGYYIPASEYAAFVEQNANAYVGIGVTVRVSEEGAGIEVVEVYAGSPAETAGVQPHDVIVGVDGQDCTELTLDEVQSMIRGEEGTGVTVSVQRDGVTVDLPITRGRVDVPVATYEMLSSGYGLITIENFDSKCATETIAAIEALMTQGAKGIIFDVRFNPGGYQHELVEVLDYILPEGTLFVSEDYKGRTETDTSDASCIEIPMAVLVNGDSYSAAEFFAAALQEYDYALVVGQQTTGKGYYQTTFRLNDGSAANISIGKYYTPNGVSLAGVGITPDVPVEVGEETYLAIYFGELEPESDPQIQAAVDALESQVSP